jgi:3-dehydroquinate synthase
MSDMSAKVEETPKGFHVEGYEKIEYDFSFTENIFDKNNDGLANEFLRLNRCLAVMDTNIFNVYGQQLKDYFDHYNIELKVHKTMIGEKAKSMETLLSIVDSMTEFGWSSPFLRWNDN